MKISTLFVLWILSPAFCFSQSTRIAALPYGGVGWMIPSSGMNERSMIKGGVNFRFGYFQPLMKARGSERTRYQLGIDLRIDYSKFPGDRKPPSHMSSWRYASGSETVPVALQLEAKEKKPDAFHFLAGPSILLQRGRWLLQTEVLLGYASFAQEPFRYTDSLHLSSDPSQNSRVVFFSAPHETNNGFVVVPGVRAGRQLTRVLASFISVDYSLGGTHDFTDQVHVPSGGPDGSGVFSFQQLKTGTLQAVERKSRLRALTVNLQLALLLPGGSR